MDINQLISSSGNMVELISNLTRSVYFIPLLIVAFLGKLFSLFISFFIGKHAKAISTPKFYIPYLFDLFITIITLVVLLAFPEVLFWIGGVK